jgi:hypothetical protein
MDSFGSFIHYELMYCTFNQVHKTESSFVAEVISKFTILMQTKGPLPLKVILKRLNLVYILFI